MSSHDITAAILIIGNEILSGRTLDTNTQTIAKALCDKGIRLKQSQTIPDETPLIAARINELRAEYNYVFTSGGIGPTHDDKTAQALADAFGVQLELNEDAYQILIAHYGGENHMNEGRKKMALLPKGAKLIPNAVSAAPGILMDNVYVMAGVPSILSSMLDAILPTLKCGEIVHSETIACNDVPESEMAPFLEKLESHYCGVEIGSYPRFENGKPSLNIIVRSTNINQMAAATNEIKQIVKNLLDIKTIK